MSGKFKNKFKIESTRMRNWDYAWNAAYFVTICAKNRVCFFGEIINDLMSLSPIGNIVQSEWLKTPSLRPDMNLQLGEFMVMPNHFHGIIVIGKNEYNSSKGISRDEFGKVAMHDENDNGAIQLQSENHGAGIECRDAMHRVSTFNSRYTFDPCEIPNDHKTIEKSISQNKFGPQSKNLASIIRGFKSAVTMQARQINPDFAWQPRFHDHVIRDDMSFYQISEYIIHNPDNWKKDNFYTS